MSRGKFHVLWAETAAADLEEIVAYVAADSPLHARRLLARLKSRVATLEVAPQRGRVVPELAPFGIRTWRELVTRPYRVIYRIAGDTVNVSAIFDSRRDLQELLLERLLREPRK